MRSVYPTVAIGPQVAYDARVPRVSRSAKPLTERQRELLDLFRRHTARHGLPPSVRDLGAALRIQISAIHRHLVALAAAGHLEHRDGTFRLPGGSGLPVPVVASVTPEASNAGTGDWVPCPTAWGQGRDLFAVRVRGDSLRTEGILDGDLVICARADRAKPGEVVVIDRDGVPTVSRSGGKAETKIAGRVIGVLRSMSGALRG